MMPTLPMLLLLPMLLVVGCTPDLPVSPVPPPDQSGQCGAANIQRLVGQPARVLETMTFAPPTRIIRPGQAVTMDYAPNRLNIEIDESERIARVYCG